MRYLLILLFLFSLANSATYEGTYSICDTCDHTTLAAAESAHEQNLVANDSSLIFIIKQNSGGTWSDQNATTIDGYTTNAAHTITITAEGTARHSAVWDGTTAYRISSSSNVLVISDDYVTIDGLQVTLTGSTNYRYAIYEAADEVVIKNCLIYNQSTANQSVRGIRVTTGSAYIYNNIVYDFPDGIGGTGDNGSVHIYNNTIVDCDTALITGYQDAIFINNICFNYAEYIDGTPYPNTASRNNAFSGLSVTYTGCSNCGANDIPSITSTIFNNYSSNDFRLINKWTTVCDRGYYLKYDLPYIMGSDTLDILGNERPQGFLWDIGAHEAVVTGITSTVLFPSADAHINPDNANTNYNETYLQVMSQLFNEKTRTLIKYDISSLSGTIDSAVFRLWRFTDDNNDKDFYIHRLTTEWVENEVEWDSAQVDPDGMDWTTDGGDFSSVIDSITYLGTANANCNILCERGDGGGLVEMIQDWVDENEPNYGIILRTDDAYAAGDTTFFESRENYGEPYIYYRPELYVEYTPGSSEANPNHRRKIILQSRGGNQL